MRCRLAAEQVDPFYPQPVALVKDRAHFVESHLPAGAHVASDFIPGKTIRALPVAVIGYFYPYFIHLVSSIPLFPESKLFLF
jgi:hypothetical protein